MAYIRFTITVIVHYKHFVWIFHQLFGVLIRAYEIIGKIKHMVIKQHGTVFQIKYIASGSAIPEIAPFWWGYGKDLHPAVSVEIARKEKFRMDCMMFLIIGFYERKLVRTVIEQETICVIHTEHNLFCIPYMCPVYLDNILLTLSLQIHAQHVNEPPSGRYRRGLMPIRLSKVCIYQYLVIIRIRAWICYCTTGFFEFLFFIICILIRKYNDTIIIAEIVKFTSHASEAVRRCHYIIRTVIDNVFSSIFLGFLIAVWEQQRIALSWTAWVWDSVQHRCIISRYVWQRVIAKYLSVRPYRYALKPSVDFNSFSGRIQFERIHSALGIIESDFCVIVCYFLDIVRTLYMVIFILNTVAVQVVGMDNRMTQFDFAGFIVSEYSFGTVRIKYIEIVNPAIV